MLEAVLSVLPALLSGKPIRGAGALLALAVECASYRGARGRIPEVLCDVLR